MAGDGVSHKEADAAAQAIVNMSDVDGDGKLDQAELEAAMNAADTDGDGVLEAEEIKALAAKYPSCVHFDPQSEAAPEETELDEPVLQRAAPSKGAIKRLKRETFLTRVRTRRADRSTARNAMGPQDD